MTKLQHTPKDINTIIKRLLSVTLLIALAACGTPATPTDAPFFTATPRPLETVAVPDSGIAGTSIPLDFIGGQPVPLTEIGEFSAAITGEYIAEIDSGTAVYSLLPETGNLPARNQLFIASTDGDASQQITFEFSPTLATGQYTLLPPQSYVPGVVTASYVRLGFDGTETRIQTFGENVDGTIRFDAVGDSISGTFQFSADYTQRSDSGEVDVQTVTITGRFEEIVYQVQSTDPFAVDVPLPTRNFTDEDLTPSPATP